MKSSHRLPLVLLISCVAPLLGADDPSKDFPDAPRGDRPKRVWIPQRDVPLHGVAIMCYGNPDYADLVAAFNDLSPVAFAPAGVALKTPPLPEMLTSAGVLPKFGKEVRAIFAATTTWRRIAPGIDELDHNRSGADQPNALPDRQRKLIGEAVGGLKMAADGLAAGKMPATACTALREAAELMEGLGAGTVEPWLQEGVEARIVRALTIMITATASK